MQHLYVTKQGLQARGFQPACFSYRREEWVPSGSYSPFQNHAGFLCLLGGLALGYGQHLHQASHRFLARKETKNLVRDLGPPCPQGVKFSELSLNTRLDSSARERHPLLYGGQTTVLPPRSWSLSQAQFQSSLGSSGDMTSRQNAARLKSHARQSHGAGVCHRDMAGLTMGARGAALAQLLAGPPPGPVWNRSGTPWKVAKTEPDVPCRLAAGRRGGLPAGAVRRSHFSGRATCE